ncbi:hypothetical protein EZJ19_12395 [Parasulfuritortus cantonensis]|uniref:Uncharacterized protein n=1 Tax=Parasulfuritortus cantonensis TaxID=2528202 RepID=A0A4R1B4D8_9PROT|nr:hypothetical protein [Parasulfuritortus cantonensis]TCJ12330.1 hypothetical protein EZJ19_12395 [Parasulfuritortus cantonensis]
MRRKVKRRLFMMSMAVAAGAAAPAVAKAGGKADGALRGYVPAGQEAYIALLPHLAEAHLAAPGWRLEMLPAEPKYAFEQDTRPRQDTRVGLALRLTF